MVLSGAVPPSINLARTKPKVVESYSRRTSNIANTAQSYNEGASVQITIDTATSGAFIDPNQSYLYFNLQITNKNPFIDYVSFGSAGVQSIIQELRWYVQGIPIEEILNYNFAYELLSDANGTTKKPLFMYKPSKVSQPIDKKHHVNAIKAPMVNIAGNPLWYNSVASGVSQASAFSSVYGNCPTNGITLMGTSAPYSNRFTVASVVDANYNSTSYSDYSNIDSRELPSNNFYLSKLMANPSSVSMLSGSNGAGKSLTTQSPGIADIESVSGMPYNTVYSATGVVATGSGAFANTAAGAGNIQTGEGSMQMQIAETALINGTYNTTLYNGQPVFMNVFGGANMLLPGYNNTSYDQSNTTSAISNNIDTHPANPLNWPYFMPNDNCFQSNDQMDINQIQDYMMFLSNVKNIPCGLKGFERPAIGSDGSNFSDAIYNYNSANFKNVGDYTTSGLYSVANYNCCLPLLSGVIGSLADKAFPALCVGPSSFNLNLKLATNKVVFQVSMDPARRVLGTTRDYIPFGGSINGLFGQGNFNGIPVKTSTIQTPHAALPDSINYLATSTSETVEVVGTNNEWISYNPNTNPAVASTTSSVTTGLYPAGLNACTNITETMSTTNSLSGTSSTTKWVTQGSSTYQSITGSNQSINTFSPIVGDGSALTYALCGLTFTGERGYAKKMQAPVLGGYNALIGSNLVTQSIIGSGISYTQPNGETCNFSSQMFLPYSVAAMEGYWTTMSVEESKYFSSQNKYIDARSSSNQRLYSESLTSVLPTEVFASDSVQVSNYTNGAFGIDTIAGTQRPGTNGNFYGTLFQTTPDGLGQKLEVDFTIAGEFQSGTKTPLAGYISILAIDSSEGALGDSWPCPDLNGSSTSAQVSLSTANWLATYERESGASYITDATVFLLVNRVSDNTTISTTTLGSVEEDDVPMTTINCDFAGVAYNENYYYILRVIVKTTDNVYIGFAPCTSTQQYSTAIGGSTITMEGTTLGILYDSASSIAETTLFPPSDVVFNTNNQQVPYQPYNIGFKRDTWMQETSPPGNMPFIPCPSMLNDIAIDDVINGAVGHAQLTRTTLNVHPAGIPLKQYLLSATPFLYKELKAKVDSENGIITIAGTNPLQPSNICNESVGCYGTFLEHSVNQSLRCFYSGNSSGSKNGTSEVSYSISNVQFFTHQIVVPDELAKSILNLTLSGECKIQTTSIHVYQTGVTSGSNQQLNIPAKISSANALYCAFQPQNYTSGNDAQLYPSFSRLCPFSSIKVPNGQFGSSTQASGPNGFIGTSTPIVKNNCSASSGSFQIQLRIGQEVYPQTPIVGITELITENIKCKHALFDTESDITSGMSIVQQAGQIGDITTYNQSSSNSLYYDCMANKTFCTAFSHVTLLNDQTYINNPNDAYIVSLINKANGNNNLKNNALWGQRNQYYLNLWTPLECTFYIAFDMDVWSGYNDMAQSGTYLGANIITLALSGCTQFENFAYSGIDSVTMYSVIVHDQTILFTAGGGAGAYY